MPLGISHKEHTSTFSDATDRFVLRRASAKQEAAANANAIQCWSSVLDKDAAACREKLSYACRYLARYEMHCLVSAHEPESLDILCSVKMVPDTMLVCEKGSSGPPVEKRTMIPHFAIVPPRHHGKGYASIMTAKLYEQLKTKGAEEPEHVSGLFGYGDCGDKLWRPFARSYPARQAIWAVDDIALPSPTLDVHMLTLDDALALAEHDAAVLAKKLSSLPADRTRFTIKPTADLWQAGLFRAHETLRMHKGGRSLPQYVGARIDEATYAIWIHHLEDDELGFTRFEAPDVERAELLLQVAAAEARWWGRRRLSAWDIDERLIGEKGAMESRSMNLPHAAWLDEAEEGDEVEWCFIERFPLVIES